MSYLIHKRSQALRAKLSFSTPMGGLDNANPTHLVILRASPLILALILLFFRQMCASPWANGTRSKMAAVSRLWMKPRDHFNEITAATSCCCQVRPCLLNMQEGNTVGGAAAPSAAHRDAPQNLAGGLFPLTPPPSAQSFDRRFTLFTLHFLR